MSSSSDRYGLAIHTAGADLGLAISNFADDRRSQVWSIGREVSNYLHLYLNEFIQPQTWSDLAFIAVAKGPGGFTGTRLGIVTARTLAQQLDLPLFAISTLATVAWAELTAAPDRSNAVSQITDPNQPIDIAVQMPARRQELYGAIYSQADPLIASVPDAVFSSDDWQQLLTDRQRPYKLVQIETDLAAAAPDLLDLAYEYWQRGERSHWSEALPFYGQSPV